MTQNEEQVWRKCTTCKKPIFLGGKYWVCSVSTCNRVRTDLVFCDLRCFDAHVPVMNHRDAGAFEKIAPKTNAAPRPAAVAGGPTSSRESADSKGSTGAQANDTLVVVSKVKAYIRARSGMNTSESVVDVLSDKVRVFTLQALERAKKSGRSTVMGRDFEESTLV